MDGSVISWEISKMDESAVSFRARILGFQLLLLLVQRRRGFRLPVCPRTYKAVYKIYPIHFYFFMNTIMLPTFQKVLRFYPKLNFYSINISYQCITFQNVLRISLTMFKEKNMSYLLHQICSIKSP